MRIYETTDLWDKRTGPIDDLLKNKRNKFSSFESKAKKLLSKDVSRVFVVMPIQGEKHGNQEEQRVYREYDERFANIQTVISAFDCVAIRIDKEHPLDDLVDRIKREIRDSLFVVADLTDERPSCYFEIGFAEALGRPIIYVASKRVFIGILDPNQGVTGKGLWALQESGIDVELFPPELAREIKTLNEKFILSQKRPGIKITSVKFECSILLAVTSFPKILITSVNYTFFLCCTLATGAVGPMPGARRAGLFNQPSLD